MRILQNVRGKTEQQDAFISVQKFWKPESSECSWKYILLTTMNEFLRLCQIKSLLNSLVPVPVKVPVPFSVYLMMDTLIVSVSWLELCWYNCKCLPGTLVSFAFNVHQVLLLLHHSEVHLWLLEKPPSCFHEGCTTLHSYQQSVIRPLTPHSHQQRYVFFFFLTVKAYLRGGITLPQGIFSVVSCSWCCLLPWHCRMTEGRDITLTSSSYAHVLKALQSSEQTHSAVVLLKLRISTEYPHADLHKSKTGSESCFRTGWESV